MNVADEIRRIENELKGIKIQLSNTRQNESGHASYIGLTDTDASYVGEAGKIPAVNVAENALEFKPVGIADNNLIEVDGAPADNEYAKWTASGLEGRTYAQVLADLSAQAGAAFDWNDNDLSKINTLAGKEIVTPANPAAGYNKLYCKADDLWYTLDSDGNEAALGGGGGGVAAHNILDGAVHLDSVADGVIAGDVIFGNATPKWDRLAKADNDDVLTLKAGLPSWEPPSPKLWISDVAPVAEGDNGDLWFEY